MASNETVHISIRMPLDLVRRIDKVVEDPQAYLTTPNPRRSDGVRAAVQRGLQVLEAEARVRKQQSGG